MIVINLSDILDVNLNGKEVPAQPPYLGFMPMEITPPVNQRKQGSMSYNSKNNKKNYEGFGAWRPDRVENSIWGSRETHLKPFSPNIVVHRDWYGNVTKVERNWFD